MKRIFWFEWLRQQTKLPHLSEANPQVYVETIVHPEKTDCLVRFMGWWNHPSSKTMKATTLQSMVIVIDLLEDTNIRRVIADMRPQMLEKSSKIGRPDWTTSGNRQYGSHMPEIIFKMKSDIKLHPSRDCQTTNQVDEFITSTLSINPKYEKFFKCRYTWVATAWDPVPVARLVRHATATRLPKS
ncbi:hypothetical protein TNCV_778131 [Trichonephila clavipes]|nr:hypothetical protein TNCV_778131 [Trichonephila clavipes]